MKRLVWYSLATIASVVLLVAPWLKWIPSTPLEAFGFVTGGWCVWLTVKEHIWNFPIGLANSAIYLVVFLRARLFADSGLQVVYLVLGFWGWYWWMKGGEQRTTLKVSKTPRWEWPVLLGILAAGTYGFTIYLQSIKDAAPFLDALTTVMSLIAQYMLTRKYLENWWVWMAADVIYVGLYIYKSLYLTSVLYMIFIVLCVAGLKAWVDSLRSNTRTEDLEVVHA